jgi:hypothetical protein
VSRLYPVGGAAMTRDFGRSTRLLPLLDGRLLEHPSVRWKGRAGRRLHRHEPAPRRRPPGALIEAEATIACRERERAQRAEEEPETPSPWRPDPRYGGAPGHPAGGAKF